MTSVPTFSSQRDAWATPPVDDVGYLASADLLEYDDAKLTALMAEMQRTRYTGWRNRDDLWRSSLHLDDTVGKTVLDYGCGVGLEAVQYAYFGNQVTVADIVETNVRLAQRVVKLLAQQDAAGVVLQPPNLAAAAMAGRTISEQSRLVFEPASFDVIHCAGVLHHVPAPRVLVHDMASWLTPGGQLRLMLYSDQGWRVATGTEPPEYVVNDPNREHFTRFFDDVGGWADWYSAAKLTAWFGDDLELTEFTYITEDRRYCTAIMVKP